MSKLIAFRHIQLGEWFQIVLKPGRNRGKLLGYRVNEQNVNSILDPLGDSFKCKIQNCEMVQRVSPEEKAAIL